MKGSEKTPEELLKQSLGLFSQPSAEQMESARERCEKRLPLLGKGGARGGSVNFQNNSARMLTEPRLTSPLPRRGIRLIYVVAAAAVAAALVVVIPIAWLHRTPAAFEAADGSRQIQYGELVRTSEGAGGVLTLADGSRVEMRALSELSLERADD